MSYEQIIEKIHAEAMAEIRAMATNAREELNRKFSFIVRSSGQRRRHERARQLRETPK